MTLLQTLQPFIDAAGIFGLTITEDAQTGAVTIDGITIEAETESRKGIGGREVEVPVYIVTTAVGIPGTRESPPDVDVIELATVNQPGPAVRAALVAVVEGRLAAYADRLDDNAQAESLDAF